MDVDSIAPGEDFINVIENAVGACEVLIAVIGRNWLTATDQNGTRRLDNPDDFIRIEIATALTRNIRVIPVIVQGAAMPRRDQLPEPLAGLSRRNAIEISDARWKYDVDRLIKVLEQVLNKQPIKGIDKAGWRPKPWQIAALVIGLGIVVGLTQLLPLIKSDSGDIQATSSSTPVASPTRTAVEEKPSPPKNTASPSPTQPERYASIQVVRVNLKGGWSRGFFTPKGYIVAMVGQILKDSDETTVTWSKDNREYRETAEVVHVNDWIALLRLKHGLLPGDIPMRNASSLQQGERVDRFINANDKTPGKVLGLNVKGLKPSVLLTTKISAAGEAGAPVIDSQGRVVAMILGGSPDKTESLPIEIIKVRFYQAF